MSLDPKQTRLSSEAAAAKAAKPPALNPDFPYPPTAFDPFFFDLETDPPTAKDTLAGPPAAAAG